MSLPVRLQHFCLEQVPAFASYLPYLAYDDDTELYLVAKDLGLSTLAWGFAFECLPHPGPGPSQATLLKGIFELPWPAGSTIQISTLGLLTETLPALGSYVAIRQPGAYRTLAKARVKHLYTMLMDGSHPLQSSPLRDLTILVSVAVPITPHHSWWEQPVQCGMRLWTHRQRSQSQPIFATVARVSRLRAGVDQLLRQSQMSPHSLAPPRLATLLFAILNPGHPYTVFDRVEPDRELRRQLIAADTQIVPTEDGVLLDGHTLYSLTPLQFPHELTIDRMGTMIGDTYNTSQQIPVSFLTTLNAVAYDRHDIAKTLQRKHAIISQQAFGPMARLIPRLSLKKEQFDIATHAMENGHTAVSAYLHTALWAPDRHQADQAVAACEALWRSHNFLAQRDGPVALNLFRESLPMALTSNPRYLEIDAARAKTILSSNAASLAPVAGDWKGTGRPIMLLVSRRGQPCVLDVFHNPYGNFNAVIAGKSGGGKSFFTNDLLLGLLGTGAQVWIIDKGKSYEKLIQTLKGDYLLFNASEPVCLNPFTTIDPDDFEEWIPRLKALVAQMAAPSRRLDDFEASIVGQAIQEAWAAYGAHCTITHVAAILGQRDDIRCRDLAQMLYPYTAAGEYARFFEGPATLDLMRSTLLLLELEELSTKPNLQSVVFLALVLAVQAAMEHGDRAVRKAVCIDEAWAFLRSPQAADFVVEIYRRFRKYNGSAITITQGVSDFFESEAGTSILMNSDMRILFPHKHEALQDPRVGLTPHELSLMRSLTKISGLYAELFIKHPTGSGVFRHIVDRQAYWLYTTDADEVAKVQSLINTQGMTLEQAITHLADTTTPTQQTAAPLLSHNLLKGVL